MKKLGWRLPVLLLGILLILAALGLTVSNLLEEEEAAETVERDAALVLENAADDIEAGTSDAYTMGTTTVDGLTYIGVLDIPAIERTLPVQSTWDYKLLRKAPCLYQGSVYTDDMIIMAHNYKSHFRYIANLQPGDEVTFTTVYGAVYRYEVSLVETLGGKAVEEMNAGDWDLTLFTCTKGGASRVTVRCTRTDR